MSDQIVEYRRYVAMKRDLTAQCKSYGEREVQSAFSVIACLSLAIESLGGKYPGLEDEVKESFSKIQRRIFSFEDGMVN